MWNKDSLLDELQDWAVQCSELGLFWVCVMKFEGGGLALGRDGWLLCVQEVCAEGAG